LHLLPTTVRVIALYKLFNKLTTLYDYKMYCPPEWLGEHVKEKIYSKEDAIVKLGFHTDVISLIERIIKEKYDELSPKNRCVYYHGDLTYENILWKNDVKLIDFDNDNQPGCVELDLGKLMQSVLTRYEFWDELSNEQISDLSNVNKSEHDLIINFYSEYLQQSVEQIKAKAYFYCALHLFRMIPYQAKTSMRRAKIAMTLSNICLQLIE